MSRSGQTRTEEEEEEEEVLGTQLVAFIVINLESGVAEEMDQS